MGLQAKGCTVSRGTSSGEGGTLIAAASDVNFNWSRDPLETTAHDATSNTKTFTPGMIDPGEITFTINYLPANASHIAAIKTDIESQTVVQWAIGVPNAAGSSSVFYGNAFVTGSSLALPVAGLSTASVTLKCTGVWTRP